jgi:hypothetical protein
MKYIVVCDEGSNVSYDVMPSKECAIKLMYAIAMVDIGNCRYKVLPDIQENVLYEYGFIQYMIIPVDIPSEFGRGIKLPFPQKGI